MTTHPSLIGILPESLLASGQTSEKLNLLTLQSKMKYDPEGYESELVLLYSQFKSSVELFKQQAALNFTSLSGIGIDLSVAKYLGNRAMLLAHVTPFYPKHLSDFPSQLANLLNSSARLLPSGLRCNITQALILLINRKIVHIGKTLALFLELQTLGDRVLRKLSFSHVIHSIRRMNKKHKNEAKNRTLQNIVFSMLQQDDEAKAKRSLVTLCELHRRKVWCNDRTSNEICRACLHSSPRIMTAALSFLYDYEKIKDNDDSDASSSEDEGTPWAAQVVLDKATIYKANHKGTIASKKKKRAKLQRAIRSMKRQQRLSSESNNSTYYSPLNHLKDPQDFAEKLFSRLQTCNERFEVKMMILKVIARTIELHRLILLDFYSFLQKYIQPHQRDITNLLAAAVQACHERVPHNEVEPLFKHIINQFVHDRSRPEAITVGLSAIREICLRMPSLMKQGLLRDLVSYKKLKVKPVSAAARSLIMLFREIYPSLLIKKDRGRLIDPKAKPKAYGEVIVASNVPGVELLYPDGGDDEDVSEDVGYSEGDGDTSDVQSLRGSDDENTYASDNKGNHRCSDGTGSEDKELQDDGNESEDEDIDGSTTDDDDENDNNNDDELAEDEEAIVCYKSDENCDKYQEREESKPKKRKFTNFDGQLIAADASLRALKRLTGVKMGQSPYDKSDGILSNEDFERIKELMAKKEAKATLMRKGMLKTSDQLSLKAVNPSKFDANRWRKLTKEERLAVIRAGREDRGKYQARTAVKQKKKGGLSNRQKEHKKAMPLAAKRAKVARSRQEKKKKQQRSGKQFCGKKAWKQ